MQQNKKSPQYLIAALKDADTKKGIVMGYLASFGNLDADNDIIMPGAFTKSLSEMGPASSKPRIKYLLDHNQSKALGTFISLTYSFKNSFSITFCLFSFKSFDY